MLDWPELRVLVTGGTGSFGNFVVRHLVRLGAAEVRVFSRDEKKQYDMRIFYEHQPSLSFVIGDIRDKASVDEAMNGIDVVFHAAALKQVPSCERFPLEAVKTNTLGAGNVVQSALEHNVECVVSISTDKAVKPVNVMGMSKALLERIVLRSAVSPANRGTRVACVRYGNVIRSRGSVIPFFRKQLAEGKPLTITDERMTRFMLTLNDAIDLVIYAAEQAKGGEIFVRKAPAARIMDVAQCLCDEVSKPLEYEVIGAFPGEKLHEIIVSEEELARTEDCGDYYTIHPSWSDLRPAALTEEFSSSDQVVDDLEIIKALIARADQEFEAMEMLGGEFARF